LVSQYDCDIIFDISLFVGAVDLTPEQVAVFLQADFTLDFNVNPALAVNTPLRGRTDPNIFNPAPEPSAIMLTGIAVVACLFSRSRWSLRRFNNSL
jgi:hypothetical protein